MSNVQYEFKLITTTELKLMRRQNRPDKQLVKNINKELKRRRIKRSEREDI